MFGFLLGGTGVIAALVTLATKALDFLLPLWYNILDLLKWYVKTFWTGLGQLLNNLAILAVIAPLLLFTFGFTKFNEERQCKDEITRIKEEYVVTKSGKKLVDTKVQKWNPFKNDWDPQ